MIVTVIKKLIATNSNADTIFQKEEVRLLLLVILTFIKLFVKIKEFRKKLEEIPNFLINTRNLLIYALSFLAPLSLYIISKNR